MSPQTLVFCNRRRAFDERKNSSLSLACERSNLILLPLFKFFVSPLLFLHRISLEFLFAWFPFVRLHFSFMHVFSAAKAWSLLFAPCCWFIILYSYSRVEIQEDTLYTFFSLISDDLNGSFFCRCVRPRAFCDFFSLSTAPSPEKRGEKIRHAFEEMDDRSPRYAFNQQRVLRKGRRTEKKSISFSTVPTTGEFVINTRFFCVAFSDADSFVLRARDSPLLLCFVLQSTPEERKFGRMNSWEKNQTRDHFLN